MESNKYKVFDKLIEGVQVISHDWKYFYVNDTVVRHAKTSRKELVGYRIMDKFPGIENTELFRLLEACMNDGKARQMINEFAFPDGTKSWFELRIRSVPDGVIVFSFDMSKQKEVEFELEKQLQERSLMLQQITEQKQQLEELCHIIAHNMRAPLSNLLLISDIVSESESMEERLMLMMKQKPILDYLHDLFKELVQALQVKIDRTVEKNWLRLDDSLKTVEELLQGDIIVKDVKIDHDFSGAESVWFSKNYLDSVVFHLLSNAIKYRAPDRALEINLKSYETDQWICLDVKDNGLGLDLKKYGNKIFKLRQTFHNNNDSKGFGLFISKTQVEALGGMLTAKSTPGEGSTFTVHFAK